MQTRAAVLYLNMKFIRSVAPKLPASLQSCVLTDHHHRCVRTGPPLLEVKTSGRRARGEDGGVGGTGHHPPG